MLDTIAKLMEHVQLGMALSMEELRALELKIATSRAALWGVIVGFVVADLAVKKIML